MGQFAKIANDWEARLAAQEAALHKVVPSTEQETSLRAMAKIKAIAQEAHNLAYGLRAANRKDPAKELLSELSGTSIPGREHAISLPALKTGSYKKAVLEAFTNPLIHGAQRASLGAKNLADRELQEKTRVTDDPSTLWWYYPSMTMNALGGVRSGYAKADDDANSATHLDLDTKIQSARAQFERALADEYRGSKITKRAESLGEVIDGLAMVRVKCAAGELNTTAGVYATLAALLGTGSYHQAKAWTEDRDPRVMKMKAVRELIRSRMRSQPPTLRVGNEGSQLAETPIA